MLCYIGQPDEPGLKYSKQQGVVKTGLLSINSWIENLLECNARQTCGTKEPRTNSSFNHRSNPGELCMLPYEYGRCSHFHTVTWCSGV